MMKEMSDRDIDERIFTSVHDSKYEIPLMYLRYFLDAQEPLENIPENVLNFLAIHGFVMYDYYVECYSVTVYGINAVEKTRE
jgi:hypothetical protein